MWYNEGHLCVAGHFLFRWTLVHFPGSTNFRQRISRTILVAAQPNFGSWPINTCSLNFVNVGLGVPRYHQSFTNARVTFCLHAMYSWKLNTSLLCYCVGLSACTLFIHLSENTIPKISLANSVLHCVWTGDILSRQQQIIVQEIILSIFATLFRSVKIQSIFRQHVRFLINPKSIVSCVGFGKKCVLFSSFWMRHCHQSSEK